jgi:hypothetical protein
MPRGRKTELRVYTFPVVVAVIKGRLNLVNLTSAASWYTLKLKP